MGVRTRVRIHLGGTHVDRRVHLGGELHEPSARHPPNAHPEDRRGEQRRRAVEAVTRLRNSPRYEPRFGRIGRSAPRRNDEMKCRGARATWTQPQISERSRRFISATHLQNAEERDRTPDSCHHRDELYVCRACRAVRQLVRFTEWARRQVEQVDLHKR